MRRPHLKKDKRVFKSQLKKYLRVFKSDPKTNHRRKERRKDAFSREIEENRSKAGPCSDLARSCPCSSLGCIGCAQGRARDPDSSTPVRQPSTPVLTSFPRSSSARAVIYAMILEMMIGMLDDMKLDKCAFFHKIFEKMIVML
ncbi:hypothetical protein QVD17_20437 [Tagetes erecta]|uniref:Uncharacterized protein n=1 Tax=Tagetes erecta TaxID=13708 RepID=A0AAD8KP52_TARER|nr:hypothetical protein QVD17_20437 [Tagetes erecta]